MRITTKNIDDQIEQLMARKDAVQRLSDKIGELDFEVQVTGSKKLLDMDCLTHPQIVTLIGRLSAGKWIKSPKWGKIDYTNDAVIPGFTVRFWSGEPPPSCKLVEEEVVVPTVPAHKEKRVRLVCKE